MPLPGPPPPFPAASAAVACPLSNFSFRRLFQEFRTSKKYSGTSSAILAIFRTFQVPYWHTSDKFPKWPPVRPDCLRSGRTVCGLAGLFAVWPDCLRSGRTVCGLAGLFAVWPDCLRSGRTVCGLEK
ncbi:hypothetical protein JCGZ_03840 [Jatropha curcas]|uniref:Uncharacterized protein n=1 Tax=Jatropha curcas TaxID=180498 RepID=A0A067L7E3_JATCU|nr:hypothetical protein JCGZ_03840 [Jatropha curcas]